MADDTVLNSGSGGDTIATDDIGGVKYQRVKLVEGADGVNDGDISAANPLPVDASSNAVPVTDNSGSLTVDSADLTTIAGAVSGSQMQVDIVADGAGLALAANQLADGHNVTVDNAAGASAVNVQDGGNSLTIDNDDTVSTNNSTTTPLAGGATFTGTGDDCLGYTAVAVTLDSSHDSGTDGMTFQFSTDNSNWDDVYLFTYTAANGARRFQFPVTARYFRVVYTNGVTLQTHFRVQTILHRQTQLTSIHRLSDDINPDRSAEVVKSVLFAQAAGSGNFTAVDATASGNLKASIEEIDGGVSLPVTNAGLTELAAAINTNQLDVNIATDSVGIGGGTQYTEDDAAPGNPVGTATVLIRDDAPSGQTTTDGDIVAQRGTNYGAAYCQIVDSSGNFIDTFGGSGGTASTDDGTFTAGSGQGTPAMGFFSTDTVDAGDVGVLAMDASRRLFTSLEVDNVGLATSANQLPDGHNVTVDNASGGAAVNIQDGGNSITVDNGGTFVVQEDGAALTALQLIDDVVATDDTSTHATGTTKGATIMAAATPTDGTVDANDIGAVAMSTDRRLHTDAQIVGTDGALDVSAATVTTTPAVTGGGTEAAAQRVTIANDSTGVISVDDNGANLSVDWGGTVPPIGAGTEAAALRVTMATDSTGVVSVDDNGGNLSVDLGGTAATLNSGTVDAGTQRVVLATDVALPAGSNAIGKLAANSGVDIGDVDVTSIAAGTNLVGDVGLSGARTSGGTTLYKNIDVDESEDQVKGTGGQVYWIHAMNLSSGTRFLKFYNATAASVTVGSTTPDLTFPIPTQGDTNGAGFTLSIPNGIAFGTAITIAATTGVADNDSGAPGANEIVVNLGYA